MIPDNKTPKDPNFFKEIVEQSFDFFINVDEEGNILYANNSFLKFLGEEEKRANLLEFTNSEDSKKIEAKLKEISKEDNIKTAYLELRILNKEGVLKLFDGFIHNLTDNEAVNSIAMTLRDITSKNASIKELKEHIEEKNNELIQNVQKGQDVAEQQRVFMSMVSHEFRTPLTIIDGNAQIIQNRGDTLPKESLLRRASTIRIAVDRLIGLIERILSGHAIDQGKLKVNLQLGDLIPLVRDVCFDHLGIEPDSKIKLNIEKELPKIMLDNKLIHHVMVNLISNAFKYSPHNPEIEVNLFKRNDFAFIEVSDNGIGVPEDELPKIFSKYFRASTAGGIPGTGLGLNLVRQIAELHSGYASIKSQVDVGTTITIKLPINQKNVTVNGEKTNNLETEEVRKEDLETEELHALEDGVKQDG